MIQAKSTGLEDVKGQFLQIIHTNIRQLTDYLRNELGLPSSYDEEILGREVAKVISYMSFNIDPLQVDVSADAVVNEFMKQSNSLKNIAKYKNFRFYKLISENNDAVSACFGIYILTRLETIKGFSFNDLINRGGSAAVSVVSGGTVNLEASDVKKAADKLGDLYRSVSSMFGPGDNGKDFTGGIYYFYKYYKGQPYFGAPEPKTEAISVGYFKGTWKPLIESESGMSFELATAYFLKYYPYIKSGYFLTQNDFYMQARKDIADEAAGKTPKMPAGLGGVKPKRKNFFQRLFGK
jgi:hypothetical protein